MNWKQHTPRRICQALRRGSRMHTEHNGGIALTFIPLLLKLAISSKRMKARNALLVCVAGTSTTSGMRRMVHKTSTKLYFSFVTAKHFVLFCRRDTKICSFGACPRLDKMLSKRRFCFLSGFRGVRQNRLKRLERHFPTPNGKHRLKSRPH